MKTTTKLVTYDDYRSLPDDGKRYEIIGGELFMTPAPSTIHQRISQKLSNHIYNFVKEKGLGEVFSAPIDVVLSMTDVVQPDLVFISNERSDIITENNIVEAPDLVVEILSPKTAAIDRNQKKALYQQYAVKEYWIVSPQKKQIEQYILRTDTFQLHAQVKASEKLASEVIEGFTLKLKDVFSD